MPSIQVTGQLVDPTTGVEGSAEIKITSLINYGKTTKKSNSTVLTDASGNYDFHLVEGKHMFHVKHSGEYVFTNIGTAIVGEGSPTPVDIITLIETSSGEVDPIVISQLQQIAAEAATSASEAQQSASEAAAIVPTLQDDINSKISAIDQTAITDADTLFTDGVHRILNLSPGNVNGLAGTRSLLHMQTAQGGFQLAARTLGHEVHIRAADLNSGNVGTWSRLYTTEYKPTAADVGAYTTGEVDSIEGGLQGQIDSLDDEYVRRYVGEVISQDWNSLVDSGNYRVRGSVGANHPSTPTVGASYDYGLLLTLNDSNATNGVKTHLYFPHNQNSPDVGSRLPVYRSGYFGDYGNWRALLSLQYADVRYSQISSDERLKTDIEEVKDALGIVEQIGSYSYIKENAEVTQVIKEDGEYTGSEEHYRFEMGFIAQEIEKVLPHLVKDDVYGYKAIKSGNNTLLAVAYQAIRELNEENKQLKDRLAAIEAHLGLGE